MSDHENKQTDSLVEKREAELPEGVESTRAGREFLPRTDIYETGESVVIVAEMPGVDVSGIDLALERNLLTLRGRVERDEAVADAIQYAEYEVGDYVRSFKLSGEVDRDNIGAESKNGILTLTLPKVGMQRKRIEIATG